MVNKISFKLRVLILRIERCCIFLMLGMIRLKLVVIVILILWEVVKKIFLIVLENVWFMFR